MHKDVSRPLLLTRTYLLVDNNTNSPLRHIPHLASAAVVHLVWHTLQKENEQLSFAADCTVRVAASTVDSILKMTLLKTISAPSAQLS